MGAAEATLDVLENQVDAIEGQLDNLLVGSNKFVPWLHRGPAAVALVAGTGVVVGAGVSYLVTRKVMTTKYESIITEQVEAAKGYYKVLYKADELADPISALEQYTETVEDLEYESNEKVLEVDVKSPAAVEDKVEKIEAATEVVEEAKSVVNNIFTKKERPVATKRDADSGWDYTEEIQKRALRPDEPYIIHHDEYMENEPENDQVQFTYFVNDDTLVDERNDIIPVSDDVVGDDNLVRFGHGSKDNNIVYVRNDGLGMDFTIVKSENSYAQDVMGFDDSLSHTENFGSRKTRRMPRYDEG